MGKMKHLCCVLLTLLLFSCGDNNPIEQDTPLMVSSTKVTLSPDKPYVEIVIIKGAGNYRVTSSNEAVAQYVLINNKLYITGFNIGYAIITLKDQDDNVVEIMVTINELIPRVYPLSILVFVKVGDTKYITNTDSNPLYFLMDTASVVQADETLSNVQITGKKTGVAHLYYLKEYWPTIMYNIQVIEHYPFAVSPTTGTLRLAIGAESEYHVLSGCGSYTLTVSNSVAISAELIAWPIEPTFNQSNPRIIRIKALQKGTSELTITNVETSEVKIVNVTVG
ncbi:MAG: hypothetical protein PHQ11_07140 [Paludibacter sp.]|nr:hypothetical protein [Paludibacter sp.]MDD4198889.1 hypothetical protein [Paludibacter sp.]